MMLILAWIIFSPRPQQLAKHVNLVEPANLAGVLSIQ